MTISALRMKVDNAKLRPAEPLYIACADFDFTWTKLEVERAVKFWGYGLPVDKIAEKLGRPITDTFVLLYDLAEQGKVDPRPGGIFGSADNQFSHFPPRIVARQSTSLTDDDTKQMASMKESGMTYRDIGTAFGVNKDAVYYRIKRLKGED